MNYTSVEQSKKLLELGLKAESADMHYIDEDEELIRVGWDAKYPPDAEHLPAWSVGALLEVMPQTNKFHTIVDIEFNRITFEPCDDDIILDESTFHYSDGKDLLEACYNMICWLLENKNNYIK